MSSHEFFDIPVREILAETEDAISIVFAVPDELEEVFRYRPGQFLTLRVTTEGRRRHRCYSLSSTPGVDDRHRVAIKRVDGGIVSNQLCSSLKPGDTIAVQPPAGLFVPRVLDDDFLLIAGGSGITPILSILKAALVEGRGQITLIYANREEKSVIYAQEIRALLQRYPDRLTVHHWLETLHGLPSAPQLAKWIPGMGDRQTFICGPELFMAAAVKATRCAQIPHSLVHVEKFVSLPDEDEGDEIASPVADTSHPARLTVELNGETHDLDWPRSTKLLDVMIDAGLDAPYSCKVGGCSACMCRIVEGEAAMQKNLILSDEEQTEGWVLACQALPVSDRLSIEIP